jgi:DNA-binding IclR family transcriptional regulator
MDKVETSFDEALDDGGAGARSGIQVIARAAAVLRMLAARPRGASLGEIAKAVGLPRSTVQRIVDALDREGLVVAGSSNTGVRLGPGLLPLAAGAKFEIAEVARPCLEELAIITGETVDLAILDQDKAVFIDQVQGSHRLRAVSAVGISFPLHSTSNGKAMLAALPASQLARLSKRLQLVALTPHTITDWGRLSAELDEVRSTGVARDMEENSLGICAVGAAVDGGGGELAAITIPVPTQRFAEKEAELTRLLLECRARVQRLLDGKTRRLN